MNLITTLVLRLALGVMFINAFLVKIGDDSVKGLEFYNQTFDVTKLEGLPPMFVAMFNDKLPADLVSPYATVLPWAELGVGLLLIFGFVSRTSFALGAAILASLFFGMFLQGNLETCTKIACYLGASLGGYALISERKASGKKILGVDDLFGGKVTVE